MIVYAPPRIADSVPLIELGASHGFSADRTADAIAAIGRACRDVGFFYVIDHGVPDDLIQGEFAAARAFFAQPLDRKLAIATARSPSRRGYEPIGLQTLDQGSAPDLKESLMLGRELGADHPLVRDGGRHEGPNQWPDLSGFRDQALAYMEAMIALGRHLGALIARSLELPADYFVEALAEPSCTTRMLRYPPQDAVADNQIGCGAHTDWGFLTILLQDDAGGLEVQNVAGDWIVARPIPNALIVNLGDMMPVVTGGLYRSTPHRVLNNVSGRARYSVASFFGPARSHRFTTVPTCLPDGAPPPPLISVGDHLDRMIALTYAAAS